MRSLWKSSPTSLTTLDTVTESNKDAPVYASFWQRLAAMLLDFVVYLLLFIVTYSLEQENRLFYVYWALPGLIFHCWYHIYLVRRYGGTPGKLIVGIRITMVDHQPITLTAAFLRESVLLTFSALQSIAMLFAAISMTDDQYMAATYAERVTKLMQSAPSWYWPLDVLIQIWVWSELVTMLFNKKRRAIHDFVAGTVVIQKKRRGISAPFF